MSTLLMAAAAATLVFCAPGYPGGAGDAQPFIDQFAKAAVTAASWPQGSLAAIYDPSEQSGLAKLGAADAVLAFVPYAFFVQHAAELHLTPLAQADVEGVGTQERWSLVAKTGAVNGPPLMADYTILSVAGYAPEFIRHSALPTWSLPPNIRIESTGQVLSALRRVAAGEHVVALLDQTQSAALPTLPFAAGLMVVGQSPPLPVAVIAIVDSRVPAARAKSLQAALLKMGHAAAGAEVLSQLRLQGFIMPQFPRTAPAP
ncbi:MAG TPA: PhnD/SsuA/transferrin family substrate-binding protein [Steroidobacteraceae bacterium]|nr:PhnD/SsuA/transferrin family substrate-binding protein [Steroidobacteraceae bacterium]